MRNFLQHYFLLFSEKTDSWGASNKGLEKEIGQMTAIS